MTTTIWREWTFEAAHRLPAMPKGHKCRRLHGHSYRVRSFLRGPLDSRGLVLDFADVDAAWAPIFAALDHRYLNRVKRLGGVEPTSERLAKAIYGWLWERLPPRNDAGDVLLVAVEVSETTRSGARYEP